MYDRGLKIYAFFQLAVVIISTLLTLFIFNNDPWLPIISSGVTASVYYLSFLICMYYFFATPYITEFRIGWLLTLIAGLALGFIPFIVPLYWYFGVHKGNISHESPNKSLNQTPDSDVALREESPSGAG